MTDTSELIEWLRKEDEFYSCDGVLAAADALEAKDAEIARLREALQNQQPPQSEYRGPAIDLMKE